jgi:hypothetical protein
MVAGPLCIKMLTPIASAASCLVAPGRAAPPACEAIHPSQRCTTPIAIAISSFTLMSSTPAASAAMRKVTPLPVWIYLPAAIGALFVIVPLVAILLKIDWACVLLVARLATSHSECQRGVRQGKVRDRQAEGLETLNRSRVVL